MRAHACPKSKIRQSPDVSRLASDREPFSRQLLESAGFNPMELSLMEVLLEFGGPFGRLTVPDWQLANLLGWPELAVDAVGRQLEKRLGITPRASRASAYWDVDELAQALSVFVWSEVGNRVPGAPPLQCSQITNGRVSPTVERRWLCKNLTLLR